MSTPTKRTPEEVKKARAAAIKESAYNLFPQMALLGLSQPKVVNDISTTSDPEGRRAIKRQVLSLAAENSILAAVAFEDHWKKARGQFLADDA